MLDGIKMAAKAALIVGITAGIIAIFSVVQIPGLDFTYFNNGLSTALALAYHWCPGTRIIFPLAIVMAGVYLSIILFHYGMIAVRWVFKINE